MRGWAGILRRIIGSSAPGTTPTSDQGTARMRLREATADLHARVDALFPRGLDSVATYRRYVLGMHRFATDFEIAVAARPRHSEWLARDLSSLALAPLAAEGVRGPASGAATRLGWCYVMAGSGMGARVLLRDARRLGFDRGRGAGFLARHAVAEDWSALQARLSALDADDAPRMAQAEHGARTAFALVRACFERSFDLVPVAADKEHA
ncbi:biliverdin-producing heme oxygenase [Luteimonas viscosa]|uniref:biliverdin-producing heme oxygenase n=1 Tax=Luteimonas viscosa TaxID=1132694 RepID=UPI0016546B37|nr:biliverdin-producing heme oxygenase [Luteimonas viscosa]